MTASREAVGTRLLHVGQVVQSEVKRCRRPGNQLTVVTAADELGEAVCSVLDLQVGLDVWWRGLVSGQFGGERGWLLFFVSEEARMIERTEAGSKICCVAIALAIVGGYWHGVAVQTGLKKLAS